MSEQHAATSADKIIIFDTTLRDGEQCPGATMSFEDKLAVAELLDAMGIDVIEAGFPIASIGDFEAVSAIAKQTKNATVAGLARAIEADIARCGDAVRHAAKPRIHTFVSTSAIHLAHQMNKSEADVLAIIARTVTQARNLVPDVEWSAMDATRTSIDYLCRCIETAIDAGATTVNLPDTVGFATPAEYEAMFRTVRERVPNADKVIFSTHCHDDLGLAVANSLAGLAGGARQIECTVNGLGERAGNAAVEEIVMALRTRRDALPYRTDVESTMLTRASKLVSAVTSFPVQFNKAIVGRNAFAHESGIHQDGMLKNALTYEIMTPESVGVGKTSLVMGKHSGRAAFKDKLRELGYQLGDNAFQDAFVRFKALADAKKAVFDEDIVALVDDEVLRGHDVIQVKDVEIHCGTGPARAILTLEVDGTERTAATIVSVSAPWPSTSLPPSSSRTVTRAWASVPPVTLCTAKSFSATSCGKAWRMALKVASSAPSPLAMPSRRSPSTSSASVAMGRVPRPVATVSAVSLTRSLPRTTSSSTSATTSSS